MKLRKGLSNAAEIFCNHLEVILNVTLQGSILATVQDVTNNMKKRCNH